MKINRLIDQYADLAQDLYVDQLDELSHGIITEDFPGLNGNDSWIFEIDDANSFIKKEEFSFYLRKEIIKNAPNILLFKGDKIESLSISPTLKKITLLKKGAHRLRAEEHNLIFDSQAFFHRQKQEILENMESIDQINFIQFGYQMTFVKANILSSEEANYFSLNLNGNEKFSNLIKERINTMKMHPGFIQIPDLEVIYSFEDFVYFSKDQSPIDSQYIKNLYEDFYNKFKGHK